MRKYSSLLIAGIVMFCIEGTSHAIPITFDVAGAPSSSVAVSTTSGDTPTASLVAGLGNLTNSLDDGQSWTFDFFTLTSTGPGNSQGDGTADITAVLAFDLPPGNVNGTAGATYVSKHGNFNLSSLNLTWNNLPQTITLANGDYFDVDFTDIILTSGSSTALTGTVSVTITAHGVAATVPEPGTLILLGSGLLGLAIAGTRKKFRK